MSIRESKSDGTQGTTVRALVDFTTHLLIDRTTAEMQHFNIVLLSEGHAPPCMLCYAMLCYAMLCYAMLCYAMPCQKILKSQYNLAGAFESTAEATSGACRVGMVR
jgi:hypothetical protein